MLGRRADKGEPVLLDRRGEIGVLGEKSEPGMDRVGAGDLAADRIAATFI